MINDDTTLPPEQIPPDPAAASETEPPVVDPASDAGAAPSDVVDPAANPAEVVSGAPGWDAFQKALESGGLTGESGGDGADVALTDVVKILTPKVIAGLPAEIKVTLRAAVAAVGEARAAADKVREDASKVEAAGRAAIAAERKAFQREVDEFKNTRAAFFKTTAAATEALRARGAGADKADPLTPEGQRAILAKAGFDALYNEFAPVREIANQVNAEQEALDRQASVAAVFDDFPDLHTNKQLVADVDAEINRRDAAWLEKVKAKGLSPDSAEAVRAFGPAPSAGKLRDIVEIVHGRHAAKQAEQRRLAETATRAAAARHISGTTTAASGGTSDAMPDVWNGEKLRGNMAAQFRWREANPEWAARVDRALRARQGI